jgi:hypothetical protein
MQFSMTYVDETVYTIFRALLSSENKSTDNDKRTQYEPKYYCNNTHHAPVNISL